MATGVYIHIPFCVRKCTYCDFYSVPFHPELIARYTQALLGEIEQIAAVFGSLPVDTIYFGGGTPSLLEPGQVENVLRAIAGRFVVAPDAEITLEANPGTFDLAKMSGFRGAGITRISLGVQSFSPRALQVLGRIHTVGDNRRSVEDCRRVGFANLNLDLIFGIPEQDEEEWVESLRQAVSLAPTHVSTYLLQPEPDTVLGRLVHRGELSLWADEEELVQYEKAIDYLTAAGYHHYEISNFALPGYACRHNLIYWQGEDYLGLGAGAVSCMGGRRYRNRASLPAYLAAVAQGRPLPVEELEFLTGRALLQDRLILGLRLTGGVSCTGFRDRYGVDILAEFAGALRKGEKAGLLAINDECVRLTRKGYFLSNEVFRELLD